jgi:transcriptional regulator with XRE-family HTH domain
MITGHECREWRQQIGVRQTRLAVDVGLDPSLLSRWELGLYRLKPEVIESIEGYLRAKHEAVKALEFPKQMAL